MLLLALVQLFIALQHVHERRCAPTSSRSTFAAMVAPLYHELAEHVDRVKAIMFVTAALCVLPSALGMGAMFPATLRVWSAGGGARRPRRRRPCTQATRSARSSGAWLPGFVLMPALGMQTTLHVGIAVNLLIGAACCAWLGTSFAARGSRERRGAALPAAAVPWLIALLVLRQRAPSAAARLELYQDDAGAFRISLARDVLDRETWGEPDLVYYRDGLSTTVTVERWGRHYSLKNNGKVDASNGDDMPTQIMVAALPLLLHAREPEAARRGDHRLRLGRDRRRGAAVSAALAGGDRARALDGRSLALLRRREPPRLRAAELPVRARAAAERDRRRRPQLPRRDAASTTT